MANPMVGGWDDGEEPWNNPRGTNRYDPYWKLPEEERRAIYVAAYQTGCLEGEGRDSRLPRLLPEKVQLLEECFVATAVYGDAHAPQVEALRRFRDDVLMRSPAGEAFVDFYYSGAGKAVAYAVGRHLPSTISVIRKGLDFVVARISLEKK